MARNTKDFISAYLAYADNKFAPSQFHLWSAISIVAGALERKVWLPWDGTFSYFPNLFVFLVAHPGIGKSSALNKAVGLLGDMNRIMRGNISFVPSQVTEAKFIDLMSRGSSFEIGSKVTFHSSGYYFASEASNSLKNIYGDFIACMTDFYDCPPFWEKATMKDGQRTLTNVCFNLLAGTTFDYLGKIITDDNIMGGFASRVTYVMYRDKLVREAKFQGGEDPENPENQEFRVKLMEDLASIHRMAGPFRATPEFASRFEEWYPRYERERQEHPSEKMQALLVRKQTTLMKLCMVLSASESSDRMLRAEHWDRAMRYLDEVEKDLPGMIRETKASQTESQLGLMQAIFRSCRGGSANLHSLKAGLQLLGFNPTAVDQNISYMILNKSARIEGTSLKLLINPDAHL